MVNKKLLIETILLSCIFVFNTKSVCAVAPSAGQVLRLDINGTVLSNHTTIQSCLSVVQPKQTCLVGEGTYNEELSLENTGTQSGKITLKCVSPKVCTVNSGSARTLVTHNGRAISDYIIDGFRFLSTFSNTGNDPNLSSINFGYDFWGDGDAYERGNDRFVFRNCYVEGAVYFYGSDNLVENCELNGKGVVSNGLTERSQPSENNIFRNNNIHDYTIRGGWSLQYTHNTLWEDNTIYNNRGGAALDCDGAGHAVYGCNIKNNHFYNNQNSGVEMENGFDSVLEGNIFHDGGAGIDVINYNINNGSDTFKSDKDYKGLPTNTIIKNNVIYNMKDDGILCRAVRQNQVLNNTIYNVKTSKGYFGGIALTDYANIGCPDWTVKNNLVVLSPSSVWLQDSPPAFFNYNFYDTFIANIYNSGSRTLSQWQEMGYDKNSKAQDPKFLSTDPNNVNFLHLSTNSPACIAGEGGKYVGAYPCNTTTATPTTTIKGDVNGDGLVNVIDIGILIDTYGKGISLYPKSDVNGDGIININDIGVVIDNYGK